MAGRLTGRRRRLSARLLLAVVAALAAVAVGCGAEDDETDAAGGGTGGGGRAPGAIIQPGDLDGARFTVGSKEFTEQLILGQITIEALKAAGAGVTDETGIEGTAATREALTSERIDMYWEYTGTAWFEHLDQTEVISDPGKLHDAVAERDAANGISWLEPSPANNTYALAVRAESRADLDVKQISDFADLLEENPQQATLCVAEEFAQRQTDGLGALQEAYGIRFPPGQLVNMEEGEIYDAVDDAGECNFGEVFATDGRIEAFGLSLLEDDEDFFSTYNPALNVRSDVVRKYPKLREIFDEVAKRLDQGRLRSLNAQVDVRGAKPDQVAQDFLDSAGITG